MSTKRILNCKTSRQTEQDWSIKAARASNIINTKNYPPSIDLRNEWWDILDQGNSGACVGFATTDVCYYDYVTKKGLDKSCRFSQRFIYMAAKETDEFTNTPTTMLEQEGTSIKAALDIARKYGNIFACMLPFNNTALYTEDSDTFFSTAAQYKISGYFNLNISIDNIKEWLSNSKPIIACINVDSNFMECPKDGIITNYNYATTIGCHAIVICGYKDQHIMFKNSWGTNWGSVGYCYMPYTIALNAIIETYGVAV